MELLNLIRKTLNLNSQLKSKLCYRQLITVFMKAESSVASDAHVSVDQDMFGDVSSISGGDF